MTRVMPRLRRHGAPTRVAGVALAVAITTLMGCATPPSVTALMRLPAEQALISGARAYEDAQYATAERELQVALQAGLANHRDRAMAHKLLAFIQCSTQRVAACEQSFRAALAADRKFSLDKAEAGNPLWGPVFQRVSAQP